MHRDRVDPSVNTQPMMPHLMTPQSKVYIAGHRGLVGSALLRRLEGAGYGTPITRTHHELDLTRQSAVENFFEETSPEVVIVAAAKVGGILANQNYGADFIRDNLLMETNLIAGAHRSGVRRLLFLGSSCIYPRDCPQPISEESLLTGPLEESNRPYAVAKIAGIELCDALTRQYGTSYLSVMPTNLYGPGDNFDLHTSHVLPALIRRFHEAKESSADSVTIWGTGTPRREFLHVDDLADACVHLLENSGTNVLVNIGTGEDISILGLAELIAEIVGFEGRIECDPSKPDGTPRKLLNVSRLSAHGWSARISLKDGIRSTYEWYRAHSPKD